MARKTRSPYDDTAGRGTGQYDPSRAPLPDAAADAGAGSVAVSPDTSLTVAPVAADADVGMPNPGLLGAVVSLFFFFPLGIFAVSAALQVRGRWRRGDRNGALAAAERAERLTYAAVGVFIVLVLVVAAGCAIYWFSNGRTRH
jgi:amino acid transporter